MISWNRLLPWTPGFFLHSSDCRLSQLSAASSVSKRAFRGFRFWRCYRKVSLKVFKKLKWCLTSSNGNRSIQWNFQHPVTNIVFLRKNSSCLVCSFSSDFFRWRLKKWILLQHGFSFSVVFPDWIGSFLRLFSYAVLRCFWRFLMESRDSILSKITAN